MRTADETMDIALSPTRIDYFRMLGLDPTPVLRRAQAVSDQLAVYRQAMADFAGHTGQFVDILA